MLRSCNISGHIPDYLADMTWMERDYISVTKQKQFELNRVVFYVFIPVIVCSSLAETVTASSIVSLWFMPVNILLTFIIGSLLGWILVKVTRTPEYMHDLVIGCCSAGNLGNLLLIIIPAVCKESNSPFGDTTTCSTNGQAYVSFSMAN